MQFNIWHTKILPIQSQVISELIQRFKKTIMRSRNTLKIYPNSRQRSYWIDSIFGISNGNRYLTFRLWKNGLSKKIASRLVPIFFFDTFQIRFRNIFFLFINNRPGYIFNFCIVDKQITIKHRRFVFVGKGFGFGEFHQIG